MSLTGFGQTTEYFKTIDTKQTPGNLMIYFTNMVENNAYAVFGGAYGRVDFAPGVDSQYIDTQASYHFLGLYNEQGELKWVNHLRRINFNTISFNGKLLGSEDNIVFTGNRNVIDFDPSPVDSLILPFGAHGNAFVSKYKMADGSLLWAKALDELTGEITVFDAATDRQNNIYLTGTFTNSMDADPDPVQNHYLNAMGGEDIFFIKLDKDGQFIWGKQISGLLDEKAQKIAIDANNDIYLGGQIFGTTDFDPSSAVVSLTSRDSSSDVFITKFDTAGNFIWVKTIGGDYEERIRNLTTDGNGNIYFSGEFQDTVDFDPGLGVYILAELQDSVFFGRESFISKWDANDGFVWAHQLKGGYSSYTSINSLNVDDAGNYYIAGFYGNDSIRLDATNLHYLPKPDSNYPYSGFIAFYNPQNTATYSLILGSGAPSSTNNVALNIQRSGSNIYCVGQADSLVTYPAPYSANYTSYSNPMGRFYYLYKMNVWGLGVETPETPNMGLYPNPARESVHLSFSNPNQVNYDSRILSVDGKVLMSKRNASTFRVNGLPGGIYFVQVVLDNGGQYFARFIKE